MASYYIDSKYARGPARWERAKQAAAKDPNSPHGKLYRARELAASQVENEFGGDEGPLCFQRRSRADGQWNRKYYACSTFCAAMQATLDLGTLEWDQLYEFLAGNAFGDEHTSFGGQRATADFPTRDARCQVCATTIHPDGTLGEKKPIHINYGNGRHEELKPLTGVVAPPAAEPETDPSATTRYFVADGMYYTLDKMQYIDLTERELFLVANADNGASLDFAEKYGRPLEELLN